MRVSGKNICNVWTVNKIESGCYTISFAVLCPYLEKYPRFMVHLVSQCVAACSASCHSLAIQCHYALLFTQDKMRQQPCRQMKTSVAFPLTKKAVERLQALNDGKLNYVELVCCQFIGSSLLSYSVFTLTVVGLILLSAIEDQFFYS